MSHLEIHQHRSGLSRTIQKLREGEITIGFIGGSITDGRSGHNWPEPVMRWLTAQYPGVRFLEENAAIGATGSDLAVFRAKRDLVERNCDLVFVEYAVNDSEVESEQRGRSREGLIRKLLEDGTRDVVLVYTYRQGMYADMMAGIVPQSIAQLESLAEHYQLGSSWMGLFALREVQAGKMRWEEWLPDKLHPRLRGSLSYGDCVIEFLKEELQREPSSQSQSLPEPLYTGHWGEAVLLPWSEVQWEGSWRLRRSPSIVWMDQVLETSAVGAKLAFEFEGRGLLLGFDFGRTSSEFKYKLDGGDWVTSNRDRPDWCGDEGWYRTYTVADDLENGVHRVEIEVIHGDRVDCWGTNFKLAMIGVI